MRTEPTWRIPVGLLLLVAVLLLYALLVAVVAAPLLNTWPVLVQVPVYLVLGLVWLLPLRRFMIWMETGRWR
ncbi:MAG TPA: DUF2842 domain-containing protein [Novosphingobium sp.]|nr:DUF2842 domain-containing protein [Novosphingobium sp.]